MNGVVKQRRVQVRRTVAGLRDQHLDAVVHERLDKQKRALESAHAADIVRLRAEIEGEFASDREEEIERAKKIGASEAMRNFDEMLEENICNRLCDSDEKLPWPVGVIIAGEQHRILQALADYMVWAGPVSSPNDTHTVVERFARECLNIPHFPGHKDAPAPIDLNNCHQPPQIRTSDTEPRQSASTKALPTHSEYWRYYLRQLD